MARSLKKCPFVALHIAKRVPRLIEQSREKKESIKTWSRTTTIVPMMLGCTFYVHNGRQHLPVFVNEDMIGHKLGEFSPTRKFISHVKKDKQLRL